MDDLWTSYVASAVAAVYVTAGVSKLASPGSLGPFLRQIGLPRPAATVLGWITAPLEVLLGVTLLAGVWRVGAAISVALVAWAFVSIQARAFRTAAGGCRCFGALDVDDTRVSFVRAFVVAIVTGGLAFSILRGAHPGTSAVATPLGIATGLAFVGAASLLSQLLRFERERPRSRSLRASPVREIP
jgi:uncharacterized membrane protein YphA (DoxX/SURF4 family)